MPQSLEEQQIYTVRTQQSVRWLHYLYGQQSWYSYFAFKTRKGRLPNRKSGAYGARILRFFCLNAKKWMIMRFLLLAQWLSEL